MCLLRIHRYPAFTQTDQSLVLSAVYQAKSISMLNQHTYRRHDRAWELVYIEAV